MKREIRVNLRLKYNEISTYLDRKVEEYNQKHETKMSRNQYVERIIVKDMMDDIGLDRPDLFELQKQVQLLTEKVEALVQIQHDQYQALQNFLEEL